MMHECLKDGCQWQGMEDKVYDEDVVPCCPECGAGPEDQILMDERLVPGLSSYA